jgi:hypothetical protein
MPEPSPLVIIVSLSVNALVNASTQHNSSALALRVALRALFLGSLNPKKQGRFMIAGGRQRAPMGAKEEHQDDACRATERLATPGERGSGRRHPGVRLVARSALARRGRSE